MLNTIRAVAFLTVMLGLGAVLIVHQAARDAREEAEKQAAFDAELDRFIVQRENVDAALQKRLREVQDLKSSAEVR